MPTPNSLCESAKGDIESTLTKVLHVLARSLTTDEWRRLLEAQGFAVEFEEAGELLLQDIPTFVSDEGILGSTLFLGGCLAHPSVLSRITQLWTAFQRYRDNLGAIVLTTRHSQRKSYGGAAHGKIARRGGSARKRKVRTNPRGAATRFYTRYVADSARGPFRSELLAGLSLAIDLGLSQPMDHMLRSAVLAQRMARELDLDGECRARIFHSTVLAWIGCHADSFELAHLFGDDISFRSATYTIDNQGLPSAALMLGYSGAGRPPFQKLGAKARFLSGGRAAVQNLITSHCHSAAALAEALGMGSQMAEILTCTFERWDGKGLPQGCAAEEVPLEMRVAQLADVAEIFLRNEGLGSAVEMVRGRSGAQFDPHLADLFRDRAAELTDGLMEADPWSEALDSAPPGAPLAGAELDEVLVAMGDFADLKSPYTSGHSRGVAELAQAAAAAAGLPESAQNAVRRAGWVHDLGRMGVSNAIWDKTAPLTGAEAERVHLHPFLSERILDRIPGCRRMAALAGAHHERLDGSGYPRGIRAGSIDTEQRILAAADAFHTSLEPRPHRKALGAGDAGVRLQQEAAEGRLDGDAVDAVLATAGVRTHHRTPHATGLTDRETEVLRLLCQGLGSREIAQLLTISPKTVRNHIEHIYQKIDVTNRVGATLFAQRNGLLETPAI